MRRLTGYLACILLFTAFGLAQDPAPAGAEVKELTPEEKKEAMSKLSSQDRMAVIDTMILKKKYKTAAGYLKDWIEEAPDNDTLKIKLADLYESKSYFQEAADIYEKLFYKDATNRKYCGRVISLFQKMRYYTVAIKYCDRYLTLDEGNIKVLEKKAELLAYEKRYSEAAAAYEEILGLEKHRDDIRLKMAKVLVKAGDGNKAASVLNNLVKTSPDNAEYKRELVFALYADKQYQEAEKVIREILRFNSRDYDIMEVYCQILSHQQRYDEAISYYYRLLQSDPMDLQIKRKIAQIYALQGKYYYALSLYDQMMRAINVSPDILRERARVLGWAQRYEASLVQYEAILDKTPADSLTRLEYDAKQNLYNRRYSSAINGHKKLITKDEKNYDARIQLAQLYSSFKRWNLGRREYDIIHKQMPTFERINTALNKLDLVSKHVNAQWSAGYEYGKSGDFDPGKLKLGYEKYTSTASVALPPMADVYGTVDYGFNRYHWDDEADQTMNAFGLSLAYSKQPAFWADGGFSVVTAPEGLETQTLYDLGLHTRFLDVHQVSLTTGKEQFLPNYDAYSEQVTRSVLGLAYQVQFAKRLTAGIDFANLAYDDAVENRQQVTDLNLDYLVSLDKIRLNFLLGERYTDSKVSSETDTTVTYFSPKSFNEVYFTFNWKEFVKGNDLSWEQDKAYYNLAYTFSLDKDVVFNHTFRLGINADASSRLNVKLDGVWEKSERHEKRYAQGMLRYFF